MFKIIHGQKNKIIELKNRKIELYKNNYHINLYGLKDDTSLEKAVFYGIKYVSKYNVKNVIKNKHNCIIKEYIEKKICKSIPDSKIELYTKFLNIYEIQELNNELEEMKMKELLKYKLDIMDIKMLIAKMSYREFINIFPIIKEYDGARFECKDYFSVIEYLNHFDLDDKIGVDNVDEFFWSYYNNDIMMFVVNEISCIDALSIMDGKKTLMESFLDEIDPDKKIHTYTYDEKNKCMQDNVTGEVFSVKKINPAAKNFKIIK